MSKLEVVPEFRFSGFNKAWTKKRLKEIGTFLGGGTPSKTNPDFWTGLIPWVSSSDITDDSIHQIKVTRFITEDAIAKSATKLVPENTILLVSRVGVGKLAVTTKNLCTSQDFANFTPSEGDAYFLAYYLKSKSTEFLKFNQGMAIQGFTKDDISNFVLYIPQDLEEQQKVVDCLSSMDDLITTNTKKLESLKLHKKGLMQKLFPEQGKSIPEFGFACNVKWIKKTFEEVYSLKTTNSLSRDKLNYDDGIVKNIHYGDIHIKFSTLFDITKEHVPFISEEISLDKIKQESYCQEGDMVFADASEDIDDVGKSIELININGEKLLSGLHTILARQKENYLVKGFGGYLFKSEVMRKKIQKESQGAKVLGISSGRISKIDVIYPIEQSEQQRIVDCLSSLDKLIDAQTKKIEVLKKYKKGLMQKLFPEIKESIA
ncbi:MULTISPECIES: restriction endonuclease subunit S [unclassified Vibrio]|uniref:restriction endonuclease subunit S n=1 Tax=unclassified Vibrio TaxID=2614977 RepID=UPI00126787E8|nr:MULTISPECIES: restriction endonuclease subunit S [unclassified Vibrio]QFT35262.1 Type I restriction modification DNA specificity domain protein [Vibrio sp. THAF64]QGM33161.1 Type I restriction modification DNA specificity domain protein [Vibrio sp. THAF191d]QGN68663.1 Type I restriction modification DNA specificity domain protein [Vibrio sp. THAF191c]